MNVDIEVALKVVGLALPIGGMIYTWIATRHKDIDGRFAAVDRRLETGSKRMDAHDLDIQSISQTIAGLPAKDDLHRMELAMSDMSGELKAIAALIGSQRDVMKRLETVVFRHEDHLLEKGSKGK